MSSHVTHSINIKPESLKHVFHICLQVQITLLDKNDSPPRFIPPSLTTVVAENVQTGHVVVTLTAQDDDLEGAVTYDLESGGDDKFEVDPNTGEFKIAFSSSFYLEMIVIQR